MELHELISEVAKNMLEVCDNNPKVAFQKLQDGQFRIHGDVELFALFQLRNNGYNLPLHIEDYMDLEGWGDYIISLGEGVKLSNGMVLGDLRSIKYST